MAGLAAALGFPYNSQFMLSGHSCCDSSSGAGNGVSPGAGTGQLHPAAAQPPHVCSCQLEQVLQQKMNTLPLGLLPSPGYSSQANLMFGGSTGRDHSSLYPPLVRQYDIKDMASAPINPAWFVAPRFDPHNFDRNAYLQACHRFGDRFSPIDLNAGARRKNATKETTSTLKAWLYEHRKNPYPTKGEKIMLAILTKMTLTQVSTWFANARRRLKKENKMTWSPRNRCGERKDSEGYSDDDMDDHDNDDDIEEEVIDVELKDKEPDKTIARTTTVIRGPEDAMAATVASRIPDLTHHRRSETSSPCGNDQDPQTWDKGSPAHRPDNTNVIWSARSLIDNEQTRKPHIACSLEDSPVKSLRKWVDGCFEGSLHHQHQNYTTSSSSSSAPSPDTPPQTPPSTTDTTERLTDTVGYSTKKTSVSSKSSSPSSSPKLSQKNERSSPDECDDKTTNREIDAALALTTLFSRK